MNKAKAKIIKAFIELSKTTPLQKISINAIIKKAAINRSTFYYYFDTIDMLILELENTLLKEFSKVQKSLYAILIFEIDDNKIKHVIEKLIDNNEDLINLFVVKKQSPTFMDKLSKKALENNMLMSKLVISRLTKRQEYAMKYIINAQLWLFAHWIQHKKDMPIEELIDLGRSMLTRGPINEIVKIGF